MSENCPHVTSSDKMLRLEQAACIRKYGFHGGRHIMMTPRQANRTSGKIKAPGIIT
jgi:acetate kinase